jgi:hypothetical protein
MIYRSQQSQPRLLLFSSVVLLLIFVLSSCAPDGKVDNNELDSPNNDSGNTSHCQSSQFCIESICKDDDQSSSNCQLYVAKLFTTMQTHEHLHGDYTKVNQGKPYASALSPDTDIDVYIDSPNAKSFFFIDPDFEGSKKEVDKGSIIIREVWNKQNELDKYTAMIKMEPGYYPEGGDFAYVVMSHDGTVLKGGKLDECVVCHESRSQDGFLFGVPEKIKKKGVSVDTRLANLARDVLENRSHLDSSLFDRINFFPYPSELSNKNFLDVYISKVGTRNYLKAYPFDDSKAPNNLPEDTVIVREVRDQDGLLNAYTLMIKGPKGYFPPGGDYYYGEFNVNGTVKTSNGKSQEGRLEECGACHRSERADMGFLFGVPTVYRNSIWK